MGYNEARDAPRKDASRQQSTGSVVTAISAYLEIMQGYYCPWRDVKNKRVKIEVAFQEKKMPQNNIVQMLG